MYYDPEKNNIMREEEKREFSSRRCILILVYLISYTLTLAPTLC